MSQKLEEPSKKPGFSTVRVLKLSWKNIPNADYAELVPRWWFLQRRYELESYGNL